MKSLVVLFEAEFKKISSRGRFFVFTLFSLGVLKITDSFHSSHQLLTFLPQLPKEKSGTAGII